MIIKRDAETVVTVYRAQPMLRSDRPLPDLHIRATVEIPGSISTDESQRMMQQDAEDIVVALVSTLPGGTFDRVLAEMLRRKLSSLVVPL